MKPGCVCLPAQRTTTKRPLNSDGEWHFSPQGCKGPGGQGGSEESNGRPPRDGGQHLSTPAPAGFLIGLALPTPIGNSFCPPLFLPNLLPFSASVEREILSERWRASSVPVSGCTSPPYRHHRHLPPRGTADAEIILLSVLTPVIFTFSPVFSGAYSLHPVFSGAYSLHPVFSGAYSLQPCLHWCLFPSPCLQWCLFPSPCLQWCLFPSPCLQWCLFPSALSSVVPIPFTLSSVVPIPFTLSSVVPIPFSPAFSGAYSSLDLSSVMPICPQLSLVLIPFGRLHWCPLIFSTLFLMPITSLSFLFCPYPQAFFGAYSPSALSFLVPIHPQPCLFWCLFTPTSVFFGAYSHPVLSFLVPIHPQLCL